jgi:hypothetical protein
VNEPSPQTASLPLPIVPAASLADAAPIAGERSMMGRLRDATATVQQIPQWASRAMSGWWPEGAPPRPPAAIPVEFQASM